MKHHSKSGHSWSDNRLRVLQMSAQIKSVLQPEGTHKLQSNVMSTGMEMMLKVKTSEAPINKELDRGELYSHIPKASETFCGGVK